TIYVFHLLVWFFKTNYILGWKEYSFRFFIYHILQFCGVKHRKESFTLSNKKTRKWKKKKEALS
ncbi:hypothetical protein ACJX0J_035586, partial [Zea mays]